MFNIFFSYSHKDEDLRNELDKHLTILQRQGIISAWHDRRITAGTEFDAAISHYLENADIILLLISADFLASEYCYNNEMALAMRMHESGKAIVIPVILRPCDWHDSPFGKLQAVPKDGKAIVKYTNLDDAFLEVTREIKKVIQKIPPPGKAVDTMTVKKEPAPATASRSSNLKIAKKFSDHEKDKFLDDAFEYIANYFEGSLAELKNRNPAVDYRYKRVDSQMFTAAVYIDGNIKSECMIFFGGEFSYAKGINYSNRISNSRNSMNESISVETDEYNLYLKSLGMFEGRGRKDLLTFEGAAECYWGKFIEPLQRK